MMKRFITLLAAVFLAVSAPVLPGPQAGFTAGTAFAKTAWPDDTGILSEAGIVVDYDSGAVLFGQNIHEKKAPASITKLLTALVVAEHADLADKVEFSHAAVYEVEGGSGNKHHMEEGDVLSVEECLYLLLLRSSNQAANALAEHVAGSIPAFAEMMNEKCAELGLEDSYFANPSGLNDEKQRTTPYDMAVIARAAFENPIVYKIDTTTKHHLPETIHNPNGVNMSAEHKLLITEDPDSVYYYPYAVAGKTGYTSVAGQTLVTLAEYNGRRLISVTMKSRDKTHYADTIALLDFGFTEFKNENIAKHEKAFEAENSIIDLGSGAYNSSDLTVDPDAVVTLPKHGYITDAERTVETDLPPDAPEGAVARICYSWDDRLIGSAYVISAKALEAAKAGEAPGESSEEGSGTAGDGESSEASPGSSPAAPAANPAAEWFSAAWAGVSEFFAGVWSRLSAWAAANARAIGITAGILAAVLIPGGLLFRKIRQDRARTAARHERRRQRLEEMGISEEELHHQVEEKRREIKARAEERAQEKAALQEASPEEKPAEAAPAAETPAEEAASETPMEEPASEETPEEAPAEEAPAEETSAEENL